MRGYEYKVVLQLTTRGMNEEFYDKGYEYKGITRGMNVGFYDRGRI